ncbi:transmembrane protein 182-like isoform X3 [Myxocyprinus asiaticus]|uniref:transmembrane protein 182-like isoform X3 n=1 Tax=Myxocyprinus asiaticus TaxID=70543 RepID=UPI0022232D49|nr:transmembrane protein 182-like isoform X3 [Myxocyprinus asiaticus]
MWTTEENNEQPSKILLVTHTSRKCERLKSTSRLTENHCLAGMRLEVLQFLAGFFGADISHVQPDGSNQAENPYLFYHEGLFWRCSDQRGSNGDQESMLAFWITNQPPKKVCMPAYLSHAPLSRRSNSFLHSDFATVQRAFWCVIFVLGVISVMIGGFVTICATSGMSHRLYEAGGALFITGGVLIWSVVLLFAVWVQVSDSLERYGLQRRRLVCPSLQLRVHYGPSFMLAPTAAFFCLLTGLLLLLISSVSRASVRQTEKQPFSVQEERV